MTSPTWTEEKVVTHHGYSLILWWMKYGVPQNCKAMLWVIYENKKPLCTLCNTGEFLKQAHRMSPKEMAEYLNKYAAEVSHIIWTKETR